MYKNGHIHAKVTMNFPAVRLLKSVMPMKEPVSRKNRQHERPRIKQAAVTFLIRSASSFFVFDVCISAIVGMSMTERELVMADGNKIQGSAIPFKTP